MCSKPNSCCDAGNHLTHQHHESEQSSSCCHDHETTRKNYHHEGQGYHHHENDHHHNHEGYCDHNHDHSYFVSQNLALEGLHCGDCAVKLETALSRMDGVNQVQVTFSTSKLSIGYDSSQTSLDQIAEVIQKLGYEVRKPTETKSNKRVYRIEGMDCADCAQKLEKKVGALPSIVQVSVNYGAAKMTVIHDGSCGEEIMKAVSQAGYTAREETEGIRSQEELPFWKRNKKVVPTFMSGILFLSAWIPSIFNLLNEQTVVILYALAMFIGGYRIAKSGLYGLKSRVVGMDFLMTIAAIGAALIGEWAEGAAVVFLFSLGETLEAYTMDRTRKSIRQLMDLAPNEALVRRDGEEMRLPVEQIGIRDIILVKPGEKIAMDGTIQKGQSTVNQAPITGESIPVEKAMGDDVFAGTINQQGYLEIAVTKLSKDNTLSRIIEMVEEAQAQKAPSQRFVDVFAKYYTPAVIVVAIGITVIPTVFFQQPFDTWFYRALMMLVVSCPCALVISTPVSIVSAIGNAAKNGILIKGGAHLERLGAISAIAFDKTGTLTEGVPELTDMIPLHGWEEKDVLRIAASIETHSEHPIAQAIVRRAKQEGIEVWESDQFTSVIGKGAQAEVKGQLYHIGNPRWFSQDLKQDLKEMEVQIKEWEQRGKTVMLLGTADRLIGIFAVADQVRWSSRSVIHELKELGMNEIVMLTGDNRGTAQAIAAQLGQIDYRAELLPQDKVASIRKLLNQKGGAAMVGDGINDAPALAASTVGIAMGAAGTDTALETADVALMADDLTKLPYAVKLSRKALRIIKQNIAFSLLIKAVFLAMIFTGWSTLWMAVLADTGSSLIVIANGMRLLRQLQKKGDLHDSNRLIPIQKKGLKQHAH